MAENEEILARLDNLIRLLCIHVVKGLAQKDQITLLARAGFPPRAIAELLGTTANTVSVTLSEQRRKGRKR
jgi:hypothetical protein